MSHYRSDPVPFRSLLRARLGTTRSVAELAPGRRRGSRFSLQEHLYRIAGVDLTRVDSLDEQTAQTGCSEVGVDGRCWNRGRTFAPRLSLSPNNRLADGNFVEPVTGQDVNRAVTALRLVVWRLIRSWSFALRRRARTCFTRGHQEWLLIAGIVVTSSVIASVGYAFDQTLTGPVPLALSLHENAGELQIRWCPSAAAQGAKLEILDGRQQTVLFVTAPLADVTYAVRSADVQVRLTPAGSDRRRTEIVRFVVREPSAVELKAQLSTVLAEAHALQLALRRQNRWISELESDTRSLMLQAEDLSPAPRVRDRRATSLETKWWR